MPHIGTAYCVRHREVVNLRSHFFCHVCFTDITPARTLQGPRLEKVIEPGRAIAASLRPPKGNGSAELPWRARPVRHANRSVLTRPRA